MTTILGLSGSLRKGSFNTMLLEAARAAAPEGTIVTIGSIRGIPLYDGDVEAMGIPDAVAALKDQVRAADGLLLVTPEYNHSLPGVFKNAIDWLTRPASDIPRVFAGHPVGVIGATPAMGGTALAQSAWLPVFRTLSMVPWFGSKVLVSNASKVFDAEGKLKDPVVKDQLSKYMRGFSVFVASIARIREDRESLSLPRMHA